MDRVIDAAAVLLFAGATAFVALYARGWFAVGPETTSAPAELQPYRTRVAQAVPRLEAHVAAGSMRDRALVCDASESLADVAAIETSIGASDDPAIAEPLAAGLSALRECLACTPEPRGCADAARAFGVLESRLALPRSAGGI